MLLLLLGDVKSVQLETLVEQHRVVGVFVLASGNLTFRNAASAKGNHLTLHVEYRYDQPMRQRVEVPPIGTHKHACAYAIVGVETALH